MLLFLSISWAHNSLVYHNLTTTRNLCELYKHILKGKVTEFSVYYFTIGISYVCKYLGHTLNYMYLNMLEPNDMKARNDCFWSFVI